MFKKFSASIDQFIQKPLALKVLESANKIFSKLPRSPKIIGKILIFLAPWMALISGVLGIVAGPLASILSLLSFVTLQPLIIIDYVSISIIMIINTFIMFKAFKPLRDKDMRGWIYLFWSNMLWLVSGIIDTLLGKQGLLSLVISNLIGFYLLFEMKKAMADSRSVQKSPVQESQTNNSQPKVDPFVNTVNRQN